MLSEVVGIGGVGSISAHVILCLCGRSWSMVITETKDVSTTTRYDPPLSGGKVKVSTISTRLLLTRGRGWYEVNDLDQNPTSIVDDCARMSQ